MAFEKPKRPVSKVFIHCSASSIPEHGNVDVIRGWHEKRGWSDIGYHYFIPFSGEVQLGRDIEKVPAAQYNHNMHSLAICLHGLRLGDFTYGQFSSLVALCKQINSAYSGYVTFHGHKEVSNKECPVFDYVNVLKLDEKGHLKLHELNPPKYLSIFSTGLEVINLQHQLNMFLAEVYKDSISASYVRETFNDVLDLIVG